MAKKKKKRRKKERKKKKKEEEKKKKKESRCQTKACKHMQLSLKRLSYLCLYIVSQRGTLATSNYDLQIRER
jgi:hypothetical protein